MDTIYFKNPGNDQIQRRRVSELTEIFMDEHQDWSVSNPLAWWDHLTEEEQQHQRDLLKINPEVLTEREKAIFFADEESSTTEPDA
jgi:hypothetical protein